MGEASGNTVDSAPAVETIRRGLSAAQIGEKVGRSARMVRRWHDPKDSWASDPCPHERGAKGKIEVFRYNLDEVRAWMKRAGLEVPQEPTRPMFDLGSGAVGSGQLAVGESEASAVFAGDPSLSGMQRRFMGQLDRLDTLLAREEKSAQISGAAVGQIGTAIKNLGQELRMARKDEADMRVARGELVSRSACEKLVEGICDAIVSADEMTRQELGAALREAGCRIGEGDARLADEVFDRVIAVKAGEVIDRQRGVLADSLRGVKRSLGGPAAENADRRAQIAHTEREAA